MSLEDGPSEELLDRLNKKTVKHALCMREELSQQLGTRLNDIHIKQIPFLYKDILFYSLLHHDNLASEDRSNLITIINQYPDAVRDQIRTIAANCMIEAKLVAQRKKIQN